MYIFINSYSYPLLANVRLYLYTTILPLNKRTIPILITQASSQTQSFISIHRLKILHCFGAPLWLGHTPLHEAPIGYYYFLGPMDSTYLHISMVLSIFVQHSKISSTWLSFGPPFDTPFSWSYGQPPIATLVWYCPFWEAWPICICFLDSIQKTSYQWKYILSTLINLRSSLLLTNMGLCLYTTLRTSQRAQ